MGLDLYIEARIMEKKTGRIISSDIYEECTDNEGRGFFEICWWCSWAFTDIRSKMIDISNKHGGTDHTVINDRRLTERFIIGMRRKT